MKNASPKDSTSNVLLKVVLISWLSLSTCSFQIGNTVKNAATKQVPSLLATNVRPSFYSPHKASAHRTILCAEKKDGGQVEEYKNALTSFLSNFMQSGDMQSENTADGEGAAPQDPLGDIVFDAPKIPKLDLQTLATKLDAELYEKEWFVTGRVNPSYFSDDFKFEDPDVKVDGIEGAFLCLICLHTCPEGAIQLSF